MTTIKSPAKFTGRKHIGPVKLEFRDGVAEFDDDLPDGARNYLESQGYGIDAEPRPVEDQAPVDSRDYAEPTQINDLRDAAVDPQPQDFLAPVNAGQGDPHGPEVVAPGIHAANMPKPIHPGPVGRSGDDDEDTVVKDTEVQDANETNLAEAVLVNGQDVKDATAAAAKVDPVNTDADTASADSSAEFDPGEHTVDEVHEYLADKDEAEHTRVLDAEKAGKARKTVLGD